MQNTNLVLVFVAVVFVAGTLLYIYNPDPIEYKNPKEETVICTSEAKLCPDGSFVGRTGPNCEFNCPTENSCQKGFCQKTENGGTSSTSPQS